MNDVKPWYTSRTIWASLVTVGLAVSGYAGLRTGAVDQTMLTDSAVEFVTAIAGITAIIGRLKATSRIG